MEQPTPTASIAGMTTAARTARSSPRPPSRLGDPVGVHRRGGLPQNVDTTARQGALQRRDAATPTVRCRSSGVASTEAIDRRGCCKREGVVASRSRLLKVDGSDGMATNEDMVRSYDASATEYAAEAATTPEWVVREIDAFVDALGGRVESWRSVAVVGATRVSSSVEG